MKISIVTPNYNWWVFIERTLLSILTQKWDFELELIIMDGLSTDNSIEEIKKIETMVNKWYFDWNCKNIKFIRKSEKDKGQSDAINKWLQLATGDILSYLNSDDTYEPGTLQTIIEGLGKSNKHRSYGKCKIINEQDQEIRKAITRYKNILWRRYKYSKLLSENFISQMTVFRKRKIVEKIWLFNTNEHLVMDYEYWLRIASKYEPLYINKHLANFRLYTTSKSWSSFVQQFDDELRVAEEFTGDKYKFAIWMHKLNKLKIIVAYKVLWFFGR